ncbi:hypothetical protein C8Q75DRAFT_237005 [Abortiporus biennis]|nr:hypothetical protein C8Q75DRAFT_237005 [Abortiporus biennis]
MAAPPEMTTLDISGKYFMNKTLSDDTDEILRLQGVGWFLRKALATAWVYLDITHYKDESGVEHVDIVQTLSGGISGTTELRTLDWKERLHEDYIFGAVVGKSRRIQLEDIEIPYLKEGWTDDVKEHGAINSYVQSDTAKSGTSWIAEQIWGFEEIEGERRHIRHVDFIGPKGEHIQARLVYDYQGPL